MFSSLTNLKYFIFILPLFGYIVNSEPVSGLNVNTKTWKKIEYDWPYKDELDKANDRPNEFYFINEIVSNVNWNIDRSFINTLKENQTVKLSFKYWSSKPLLSEGNLHKPSIKFGKITYGWQDDYSLLYQYKDDRLWMPFETIISKEQLFDFNFVLKSYDDSYDSITAIKDLQVEYEIEGKTNNLFDGDFKITQTGPAGLTFPYDCYMNNIDSRCYPEFKINPTEKSFKIEAKMNSCFKLDILSHIESEIRVYIRGVGDKIENLIHVIKPLISLTENPYEEKFCLSYLTRLNNGNSELLFEVKLPNKTDVENSFAIKIQRTDDNPNGDSQLFLSEMKKEDGSAHKWSDEWQISPYFKTKESWMEFSATAFSEAYSTAILYSKVWVKLDKQLSRMGAKINIEVETPEMFHSFRIRPKICDEYFHCIDMAMTNLAKAKLTTTFDFDINTNIETNYIKLIIYVEYFKPSFAVKGKEYPVKFNLKLINFGNPCFQNKTCEPNGVCSSNLQTKGITCLCNKGYIGDNCMEPDYCGSKLPGKAVSGQTICNQAKAYNCYNYKNNFTCGCSEENNPNWNGKLGKCEELTISKNKSWVLNDYKNFNNIYPKDEGNEIVFDFNGLENDTNLCLTITYQAKNNSILKLTYLSEVNNEFQYFLEASAIDNKIDVCTNHFRYTIEKSFSLSLKIISKTKWSEKLVVINGIESRFDNNPIDNPIDLIDLITKWDLSQTDFDKHWRITPSNNFQFKPTGWNYNKQITPPNNFIMTTFLSKWINAANFKDSKTENYFNITIGDNKLIESVKIKSQIIYHVNENTVKIEDQSDTHNSNVDQSKTILSYKLNIPDVYKYFRIIIEITVTENVTIQFNSVSVGDPCFINYGQKNICNFTLFDCPNRLPNNKNCNCKHYNKKGEKCDWDDICSQEAVKKVCDAFPKQQQDNCKQTGPKEYNCICPENFFQQDTNKTKCMRTKSYEIIPKMCKENSCEFLSNFLKTASWANKQLPQILKPEDKDIIPFYYNKDPDNQITFELIDKNNNDLCIDLQYKSLKNSNISVFYENNFSLKLPKISNPNEFSKQKICVSDLTDPVATNLRISFKQIKKNEDDITIVHLDQDSIKPNKIDTELLNNYPYLIQSGILPEIKYKAENQWPLSMPSGEWLFKENDKKVVFKAQHSGKRESYLFSHWLTPKDGIMFRSQFAKVNLNKGFQIEFLIYDHKLSATSIKSDFEFDKANATYNFLKANIPKQTTNFRFAIKVIYDSGSKINNPDSFELQNIDIGDPCVKDGFVINNCTDRGLCKRDEKELYGYKCDCKVIDGKTFNGTDCQDIDYCKSYDKRYPGKLGNQLCNKTSDCSNVQGLGPQCICESGYYWDFEKLKCTLTPKCLSKECEKYHKCSEDEKSANCDSCIEGFVKINKTNKIYCELYDPCNNDHRIANNEEINNLCSNVPQSKCIQLFNGSTAMHNKNSWDCICKEGYINIGAKRGSTICHPVFCDFPSMNKCEQKCVLNSNVSDTKSATYTCDCFESYIKENNKCKFNTNYTKCDKCDSPDKYCDKNHHCLCNEGYVESGDKCILAKEIDLSLCPTGNLTNVNGKMQCDCGKDYVLNPTSLTCELKPICGPTGTGRTICDNLNKLCVIDLDKHDKYRCECLTEFGQIENSEGKCVNFCDIINDKETQTRSEKCSNINAKCNPNLSKPEQIKNEDYCECAPGFDKVNKECLPTDYNSKFNLQFKDEFPACNHIETGPQINQKYLQNDNRIYIKDFLSAFTLNQKMKEKYLSESRMNCIKNETFNAISNLIDNTQYHKLTINDCNKPDKSEYINCIFYVTFIKPGQIKNENFFNKLRHSCYKYDENNCFIQAKTNYYSLEYQAISSNDKIVLNYKTLQDAKTSLNPGCGGISGSENPCPMNSDCISNNETSLFSCKCNDKFYDLVLPIENLRTYSRINDNYKIQKCKVMSEDKICPKTCLKPGNNCVYESRKKPNGNWEVAYACNCREKNFRNNVTECTESCSNVECKNGEKIINSDGVCQCVCSERFYGHACDSEYSAGKGGWIAGIVILAVLVVILAGVAFMFARRSRNNSTEYSGRPMDDYTGSSYRVPPNQSRGQQNPSFTRE